MTGAGLRAMSDTPHMDRLDRHALVMAIWCPASFLALALLHHGVTSGGGRWIAAGFVPILGAFVGHVIVNAVLKTEFTAGETALGAGAYGLALVGLLLTALLGTKELVAAIFLPAGIGLAALLSAVIIYLVIRFGPRGAFERFEVVRDNNPRPASRLPHRGGRR